MGIRLPTWVWIGAVALSSVAGMVNVVALLGSAPQAASPMTGRTSQLRIAIAQGHSRAVRHLARLLTALSRLAMPRGLLIPDHGLRLDRLARANPYTLSGGEKRRLTVAAALATRPRMLVLDEPTFGQDSRTWAELVAMLAALRDEGTAIVTITHDLDVARALRAERHELGGIR